MYHSNQAPILLSVFLCNHSGMGESGFVGMEKGKGI